MEYTNQLKQEGYTVSLEKQNEDGEGYDLMLEVSNADGFYSVVYSMSQVRGSYYSFDFCDSDGDGDSWDFDNQKLVCEFLEIEELTMV